jgi:hypothetical protein
MFNDFFKCVFYEITLELAYDSLGSCPRVHGIQEIYNYLKKL